ncbi:MAG: sporulation protein [Peptococcaceae bacterium BRH_c4b]|nr:MAG: sporulation protein [Peptococcaceae bacterium BRH_c4b]
MGWSDFKRKMKRQMSDVLEIPSDVMLDLPKIVMVGNLQVFIENHRGIVEYTSETVRVNVSEYEVVVKGENLLLRNILPEEISVDGKITGVYFE